MNMISIQTYDNNRSYSSYICTNRHAYIYTTHTPVILLVIPFFKGGPTCQGTLKGPSNRQTDTHRIRGDPLCRLYPLSGSVRGRYDLNLSTNNNLLPFKYKRFLSRY